MGPAGNGIHIMDVQPLREQERRPTCQLLAQDEKLHSRELTEIVVEDEQESRPWWHVVWHDRQLLQPALDLEDLRLQILGGPERSLPLREPLGRRWPRQGRYGPTHGQ